GATPCRPHGVPRAPFVAVSPSPTAPPLVDEQPVFHWPPTPARAVGAMDHGLACLRATLRRGGGPPAGPRPRAASDAPGGTGRWRSGSVGGSGSRAGGRPDRAAPHASFPL